MEQKHAGGAPILILAVLFTAFAMRSPMTSLSAILKIIQAQFHLSGAVAGSLTTIPTILFALLSICAPMLLCRWRAEGLLLGGTLLIGLGILVRSYFSTAGLFCGTVAIGAGVGICNIMIPKTIKQSFPNRIELFTALYISAMTLFAALGSGLSTPLARMLGWPQGLAVWSALALAAAIFWAIANRCAGRADEPARAGMKLCALLKKPMAWKLTLCMGTQSMAYFGVLAWLPVILQDKGMGPETAGFASLTVQLVGMVAAFSIPMMMKMMKDNRIVHILSCVSFLIGLSLLLLRSGPVWLQIIMLVTLGWGTGVGLAYTMTVLSLRASSAEEVVSLSAMVQTGGYIMAAIGPVLLGCLYDWSGSRNAQVLALMVFIVGYLAFGTMVALRPGKRVGIE